MNEDGAKKLRSIVNASGFPFQLAVEEKIQSTRNSHDWTVVAREHPWRDATAGSGGFIDLVLDWNAVRMVMECKRHRDSVWVFLVPQERNREYTRVRCQWIRKQPDAKERWGWGWDESSFLPASHESEFCAVRGQRDGGTLMLERICGYLLAAQASLVEEELRHRQEAPSHHRARFFLPAVVTSAQLQVCVFNPKEVSLEDGVLASGSFQPVPFVRFRKTLANDLTPGATPSGIKEANEDKERTVIVINASKLLEFLEQWRTDR